MTFCKRSLDTIQWLTTSRHVASFPPCIRVGRVTPEFFVPENARVSTVVAGVLYASIRIHVVLVVGMWVRRLRRPGLTLSAAVCYGRVPDVVLSVRRRVAVFITCAPYVQPVTWRCRAVGWKLISWSLTSLFSTNMAISETNGHSL